jgi:hypothetical protein
MSAKHSTKWFWSDWSGDEAVRRLTPAERGLWIDLLAIAAAAIPAGYVVDARGEPVAVEEIARFANCSAAEASSLIDGILIKGAASRDRTGRLYSRRIVRDVELSVKRRRAGLDGAAATKLKWQALNGVPEHLPGHVPRQTGRAPLPKERLTSSFTGAAREAAVRDTAGSSVAATPAGFAKEAREAVAKTAGSLGSDELVESIQKRGWVKPC